MKFRKKPVVVEAWQYEGWRETQRPDWLIDSKAMFLEDGTFVIDTLEGRMTAQPGDWIIRGVKGEIYPCKPDVFAATYEPV